MVPIAHIVSCSEALVLASMLQAAGIIVTINGERHASAEIISVALGHYLVTVPDWQHEDAASIILQTFAAGEWRFSESLQTAVIKLLLAQLGASFAAILLGVMAPSGASPAAFFLAPWAALGTPVNPQGRSDYYLA